MVDAWKYFFAALARSMNVLKPSSIPGVEPFVSTPTIIGTHW